MNDKKFSTFSVPVLPEKKQEKQLSPGEFRQMLQDVIEAFEKAGKPVKDITLLDGEREVKMSSEFIKKSTIN